MTFTKENQMSVETTLESLRNFCLTSTGDTHRWLGKQGTYHWNLGRDAGPGQIVNGVVRKLAGKDAAGNEIWVVAGSLKIDPNGAILRFTGLPRKTQKILESTTPIVIMDKIAEVA
jgi:hypothetical protein